MSAVWNCPSCEAANPPRVKVCEGCGYERGTSTAEPPKSNHRTCERCGDESPNTAPFHPEPDDGAAPEDRGKRLCPSCWILALKRRAELDPISAEERARLRQELAVATDRMEARVLSRSLKSRAPATERSEVPTP